MNTELMVVEHWSTMPEHTNASFVHDAMKAEQGEGPCSVRRPGQRSRTCTRQRGVHGYRTCAARGRSGLRRARTRRRDCRQSFSRELVSDAAAGLRSRTTGRALSSFSRLRRQRHGPLTTLSDTTAGPACSARLPARGCTRESLRPTGAGCGGKKRWRRRHHSVFVLIKYCLVVSGIAVLCGAGLPGRERGRVAPQRSRSRSFSTAARVMRNTGAFPRCSTGASPSAPSLLGG